jgi:hypothetical protein
MFAQAFQMKREVRELVLFTREVIADSKAVMAEMDGIAAWRL